MPSVSCELWPARRRRQHPARARDLRRRPPAARASAAGVPALREADDVYTNHIHADDLAMMTCAALRYGRSNRAYNASDDSADQDGRLF
jgi:hypothetical protein